MGTLKQLLTPLDYLRIEHSLKRHFDIHIPVTLTVAFLAVAAFMPLGIPVFGERGLIVAMADLISILTGFFIASLAAVATFERASLDEPLAGEQAHLEVMVRGNRIRESLTRRRFLCYLFGYLSFLALLIYFVGVLANLLVENVRLLVPVVAHAPLRWTFLAVYSLALSNLTVTTLLGLHYMTDRINR